MHSFTLLVLRLTVCFLSSFPDSLPQLFLRCLLQLSFLRIFRFASIFFRPFQFYFRLLSLLFLSFRSCWSCLTAAVSVCVSDFSSTFSPLSPPWFLMACFVVLVLDLLLVSFRSTLFRSRSCSTGDSLWLLIRDWCLTYCDIHLSFSIALLSFLFLSFRSCCCCLTAAVTVCISAFASYAFPIISTLISHGLFLGSRTRLADSFLSFCPASLPQPFHRWFPLIFSGTNAWLS